MLVGLSCAHAPTPAVAPQADGPEDTIRAARLEARAALEALPLCVANEWAQAEPVATLLGNEPPTGTQVRVKGVLRPHLLACDSGDPFSLRLVSEFKQRCKERCISQLRLADVTQPALALGFPIGSHEPKAWDCSERAVQEELAPIAVLVWGQLGVRFATDRAGEEILELKPDRMCRAAMK